MVYKSMPSDDVDQLHSFLNLGQPATSLLLGFLQFGHWYYLFSLNPCYGKIIAHNFLPFGAPKLG